MDDNMKAIVIVACMAIGSIFTTFAVTYLLGYLEIVAAMENGYEQQLSEDHYRVLWVKTGEVQQPTPVAEVELGDSVLTDL